MKRRRRKVMAGRLERRGAVDESEEERRVCTQGEDCEREKVCSGLEEQESVEIQAFSPKVYERQRRMGEEGLEITTWVTPSLLQWWVHV